MGRWGDSFFADDLAMDMKAGFDEAVDNGGDPAEIAAGLLRTGTAREILEEFSEDERDEMFWEESAGLIFAAAVLQSEYNSLQPETLELALEAIKQERNQGASDERLHMLSDLEKKLKLP